MPDSATATSEVRIAGAHVADAEHSVSPTLAGGVPAGAGIVNGPDLQSDKCDPDEVGEIRAVRDRVAQHQLT
jgi:hypothetical protein